jgi:hypothetical protein
MLCCGLLQTTWSAVKNTYGIAGMRGTPLTQQVLEYARLNLEHLLLLQSTKGKVSF